MGVIFASDDHLLAGQSSQIHAVLENVTLALLLGACLAAIVELCGSPVN